MVQSVVERFQSNIMPQVDTSVVNILTGKKLLLTMSREKKQNLP